MTIYISKINHANYLQKVESMEAVYVLDKNKAKSFVTDFDALIYQISFPVLLADTEIIEENNYNKTRTIITDICVNNEIDRYIAFLRESRDTFTNLHKLSMTYTDFDNFNDFNRRALLNIYKLFNSLSLFFDDSLTKQRIKLNKLLIIKSEYDYNQRKKE